MNALTTRDEGPVRVLTLDRPAVRNALSHGLITELHGALRAAAADDSVRAVVLTGEGVAFCAGLDLAELEASLAYPPERHASDAALLASLFEAMLRHPKPIVAAVNGHAVAGGAGLVTACDFAIMAAGAKFGYTEARIGFVAALVSVMLLRQVGERVTRDLLLSARLISAEEALGLGLLNEVVKPGDVLARALEVAEGLCRNAPGSLALTKRLLAEGYHLDLGRAFELAQDLNTEARTGAELAEGVRAFLEKREPAWRRTE